MTLSLAVNQSVVERKHGRGSSASYGVSSIGTSEVPAVATADWKAMHCMTSILGMFRTMIAEIR
jgi:hypothetical protein